MERWGINAILDWGLSGSKIVKKKHKRSFKKTAGMKIDRLRKPV
jgi:hypothetical protein